jgi:hypothetical protein
MSIGGYTACPAGAWTQLYSGPSDGYPLLSSVLSATVDWNVISSDPPWTNSGTVDVPTEGHVNFWFGLPAVWAVIKVKPREFASLKIS